MLGFIVGLIIGGLFMHYRDNKEFKEKVNKEFKGFFKSKKSSK